MTNPALQHEDNEDRSSNPLHRERLRISNACQPCRRKKAKCDGGRPACARCQGRGKACTYSRDPLAVGQQARRKAAARSNVSASSSLPALRAYPSEPPSTSVSTTASTSTLTAGPRLSSDRLDRAQNPDQSNGYCIAHGHFAGEVAAAIDVRAGHAPAATSYLVPFVDAPLFGDVDLRPPRIAPDLAARLPPRAYADRLVGIYWQHIDPMEPVLDRARFSRNYELLYSQPGRSPHPEGDIWASILNAVFALAVQRQESTPLQQRDEEGNRYFQCAWALLRSDTLLWEPASLEKVQCLMLINRYLHCTSNPQKTWVTAGLAIRIVQSMCRNVSNESHEDRQLRQRVWASCIALDRCVSWSLGKTMMPSLINLPARSDLSSLGGGCQSGARDVERLRWGLELHEICNQIQLAQTQTRNTLAARLGLPRLYQQDEYHAVAVQLDACLNKWEDGLPDSWKLQNLPKAVDRASRAERYLLHLRLLHYRIFLYRPMLARFYSTRSRGATYKTAQNSSGQSSLSDRLLKECAKVGVEAAQKVVSLVIETIEPDEAMGLLPWWHRIYYLHIAGTSLLAAMFGPELFTESVSQSWHDVMSALRAHEHLSKYIEQCVRTFETLSARILETQTRYSNPVCGDSGYEELRGEDGTYSFFDDIFQGLGFDSDNLFGMEDIFQFDS